MFDEYKKYVSENLDRNIEEDVLYIKTSSKTNIATQNSKVY